ncbi:MAG: hypothetical protein RQ866_03155 [Bacteroidales bacterium]|nr:hypothetical protein [Bacteroidales bacterium]
MKNIINLLIVAIITGCSTPKLVTQDTLEQAYPCGKESTGVNLRITNEGVMYFNAFSLIVDKKYTDFAGCKPGETTCYKNVPYIYTNNEYAIKVYPTKYTGVTYRDKAIYGKGEKITTGDYTLVVKQTHFTNPENYVKPEIILRQE